MVVVGPVALGTVLGAAEAAAWQWGPAGLALAAVLLIAAAANLLNDYADHLNGCDAANPRPLTPWAGGSRFIQAGRFRPAQVAATGWGLLAAGVSAGLLLSFWWDLELLRYGAVGAACAVAYSLPPWRLQSRGWGEPVIALCYGVLPVVGAYRIQTGTAWELDPWVLGLAIAPLSGAVLLVNGFPDRWADARVGKRTCAVRWGAGRAEVALRLAVLTPFAGTSLAVWLGWLAAPALVVWACAPFAACALWRSATATDYQSGWLGTIRAVIATQVVVCAALTLAIAVAG